MTTYRDKVQFRRGMLFGFGCSIVAIIVAFLIYGTAIAGSVEEPVQFAILNPEVLLPADDGFDYKWLLGLLIPAGLVVIGWRIKHK